MSRRNKTGGGLGGGESEMKTEIEIKIEIDKKKRKEKKKRIEEGAPRSRKKRRPGGRGVVMRWKIT